jgi:hypothetical protein
LELLIDGEYVQKILGEERRFDCIALLGLVLKEFVVYLPRVSSIAKHSLRYTYAKVFDGRQGEENWDDWLTVSNALARVDFVLDWGRLIGVNRIVDEGRTHLDER